MESSPVILVVDDVPMFRELGSLFLARAGRIVTASDGDEALALAREHRPALVVSDLRMPRRSGADLCRMIRSEPALAKTPVILLVGSDLAQDHAEAIRSGADDVLPKPINRVTLLETVNRFLRTGGVRGLPRVDVTARVRLVHGSLDTWATARNVSRGGLFVEIEPTLPPDTEVRLELHLPEAARPVSSTARVVWHRRTARGGADGMGLRFVGLDAASVRCLEDYVHERAAMRAAPEEALRA